MRCEGFMNTTSTVRYTKDYTDRIARSVEVVDTRHANHLVASGVAEIVCDRHPQKPVKK